MLLYCTIYLHVNKDLSLSLNMHEKNRKQVCFSLPYDNLTRRGMSGIFSLPTCFCRAQLGWSDMDGPWHNLCELMSRLGWSNSLMFLLRQLTAPLCHINGRLAFYDIISGHCHAAEGWASLPRVLKQGNVIRVTRYELQRSD